MDIECGMNAIRLSVTASELPDRLRMLRNRIAHAIPVGFGMHDRDQVKRSTIVPLAKRLDQIFGKHPAIAKMQRKRPYDIWIRLLASLSGGNHFIDLAR
ncbi:MAG: RtcB family protein [Candidatus Thiodiazotropha sp.]